MPLHSDIELVKSLLKKVFLLHYEKLNLISITVQTKDIYCFL